MRGKLVKLEPPGGMRGLPRLWLHARRSHKSKSLRDEWDGTAINPEAKLLLLTEAFDVRGALGCCARTTR
jgi:hypothetical protein